MAHKIGIVDTTFARVDMAKYALEVLMEHVPNLDVVRYTVPGVKDLPAAVKKLIDDGCEAVMTFGWVGPALIDKYCYLTMGIGLTMLQALTGKHVIDVTVHEDEAVDEKGLRSIAIDRAKKHALNLVRILLYGGKGLIPHAGKGLRQGVPDVGPIE